MKNIFKCELTIRAKLIVNNL